ncbi:MAG: hypothetical protein MUE55_06220 [Thermoplasmata archaeon]|jgi:hypothetical protein|nr:hypothetical protein [Thermoplasmata archaeon]
MDGEVAFAILLVSHGNLHLSGRSSPIALSIPGDLPTLKYVDGVNFVRVKRSFSMKRSGSVAKTIEGWFDHLRAEGARRLRLMFGEEVGAEQRHTIEGLGSRFLGIQVDYESRGEFWVPDWSAQGHFWQQRIWRVTVNGAEVTCPMPPSRVDLEAAKIDLRDALKAAIDVAGKMEVDDFATRFHKGLAALDSDMPVPPYYPEIIQPFGYGLPARQLIAGASYGWVFGGMGSWNDIGSNDAAVEREYEEVTEKLRHSVKRGLTEGVNSFRL